MSEHFDILTQEVEKLAANKSMDSILSSSNDILRQLKNLQKEIENSPTSIDDITSKIKKDNENILKHQKHLNKSVKNYSVKIDKMFDFNLSDVYPYETIDIKNNLKSRKLLERSIIMDLLRNGQFEIASKLEIERNLKIPFELITKFKKLNEILLNLRENNELNLAIDWASLNSSKLKKTGSDLEFNLHKLQFIKLYNKNKDDPFEAYNYAKENFPNFGLTHLDIISKLLFSMIYSTTTETNTTIDKNYINEMLLSNDSIYTQLCQDYCSLIGLSSNSPIYNTLLASYISLPNFIKYTKIFKNSGKLNWTSLNELPFEINLPIFLQFHSILICPVSKEETTFENPPMVLPCYHIISKDSLIKLSKNNLSSFKCPYCPVTSTSNQAIQSRFIDM
ncbi:hypothetical protein CANARDRAFT_193887 [[Candida] arabinofermentans NRRL YB-2248]|uniref:GID complex catalytic subunit 2 n=1 Tax=[Candida] arabinofermentans NRRL YB-2248 TaxID=983967 RepID=A0A1E4T9B2_9ASCO|nr:hypothetical protein CANARDRAFT_193887 [[Candida] arabinofermentans NRRL YB-2248]